MMIPSIIGPKPLDAMVNAARAGSTSGVVIEVGVLHGGSAQRLIHALPEREIHLFDTFNGLPTSDQDKGDAHKVGEFRTDMTWVPELMASAVAHGRVHIHVGNFSDTWLPALRYWRKAIAFVHCDVDQYHSTRDVLEACAPNLKHDGMIWLDDYYGGLTKGCRRAVDEFLAAHNRFTSISIANKKVVVRSRSGGGTICTTHFRS